MICDEFDDSNVSIIIIFAIILMDKQKLISLAFVGIYHFSR